MNQSAEQATVAIPPAAIVETDKVVSRRFATRLWWVTIACVVLSAWLFWYARQRTGDLITIQFGDGYGIKPEDHLRYRGIDIGSVERVELGKDKNNVVVYVRLTPESRTIAAEGARFWIVRPVFSLDAIRGLDTLIGAKYLAVEPPSANSKLQNHFIGLEAPPISIPDVGALEITLDARNRGGLENGAPILYRGFSIGKVIQVGLASDARTVQARCAIDSEFRELVRMNSKFWNRSGWRLDVGLTGIKLDADTLSQMVSGGIEMATPADGSGTVSTGHRFELSEAPDPAWAEWKPSLVYGKAWNDLETRTPQPLRLALRWQERRFGFRTNQQRAAWCLPLDDGSVLCLSNQVYSSSSAIAGSTVIELAGISISPDQLQNLLAGQASDVPQVVQFSLASPLPADVQRWSAKLISNELPADLCDVYIAQMDLANFVSVDSARLKVEDKKWTISETITMSADLNGSPVLSLQSGKVIGLLYVDSSIGTILPLK